MVVLLNQAQRHEAKEFLQHILAVRAGENEGGDGLIESLRLQIIDPEEMELFEEQAGFEGWAEIKARARALGPVKGG